MGNRLQIALMASLTAISFLSTLFSTMPARAQAGGITPSTDDAGRKIYVNGDRPATGSRAAAPTTGRSPLVYWSSTEHRFKPVPTIGAEMRGPRPAASEVTTDVAGMAHSRAAVNPAPSQ